MSITAINKNIEYYPSELHHFLSGAKLYDSSCSQEARVVYIDKNDGYYLKSAQKGKLECEAVMTRYFHSKGLASKVIAYISYDSDRDWLLTEKVQGNDCTAKKYLEEPERLCDILAERLAMLHSLDTKGCPVSNHTELYIANAGKNKTSGVFNKELFPDSWGYKSEEEAWRVFENHSHELASDTLLHGDYCLPNIILKDWQFSGFIDLGNGGIGDKHVDIFWALWSLAFNLKTDRYRQRFIDAYGRDNVDEEILAVVAAVEVFG